MIAFTAFLPLCHTQSIFDARGRQVRPALAQNPGGGKPCDCLLAHSIFGCPVATAPGGNPIGRGHNFLEYGRWDEIGSVDKIYDMKYVFNLGVSEEMRRVSGPQRSFISSSTPEQWLLVVQKPPISDPYHWGHHRHGITTPIFWGHGNFQGTGHLSFIIWPGCLSPSGFLPENVLTWRPAAS